MRQLRIQVFQHVTFEGLGAIEPWARSRGHVLSYTRWHAGETPPMPADYDWLIVMGGPMGVHDEDEFPWLREEKRALEAALENRQAVLGICLGAQLLAQALGARVYRNQHKEIGWFPIRADELGRESAFGKMMPERLTSFHWHGETFSLPPGALRLAASEACAEQGFAWGDRVVGLQFHPEATEEGIRTLAASCPADLTPGPFVQSLDRLGGAPELFAANREFLYQLLAGMEAALGS